LDPRDACGCGGRYGCCSSSLILDGAYLGVCALFFLELNARHLTWLGALVLLSVQHSVALWGGETLVERMKGQVFRRKYRWWELSLLFFSCMRWLRVPGWLLISRIALPILYYLDEKKTAPLTAGSASLSQSNPRGWPTLSDLRKRAWGERSRVMGRSSLPPTRAISPGSSPNRKRSWCRRPPQDLLTRN
jgi:hypothetical protein